MNMGAKKSSIFRSALPYSRVVAILAGGRLVLVDQGDAHGAALLRPEHVTQYGHDEDGNDEHQGERAVVVAELGDDAPCDGEHAWQAHRNTSCLAWVSRVDRARNAL